MGKKKAKQGIIKAYEKFDEAQELKKINYKTENKRSK